MYNICLTYPTNEIATSLSSNELLSQVLLLPPPLLSDVGPEVLLEEVRDSDVGLGWNWSPRHVERPGARARLL